MVGMRGKVPISCPTYLYDDLGPERKVSSTGKIIATEENLFVQSVYELAKQ